MRRIIILWVAALVLTSSPAFAQPFAIRGIKGLWWQGAEDYKNIMKWMPKHHFNFLMFCYTSFAGSGSNWRAPYTDTEKQDMKEIADYCRKNGVDLCLSINPGIWSKPPLCYASDTDYELLYDKLADIHKLGIDWFALCLDDISREITPEDKERFGTLAAAQAHMVNRLYADLKRLDPKINLIFCPSAYTTDDAKKHIDYTTYIGKRVYRGVHMFWTGPTVCSASISEADAIEITQLLGRKPIIWDNYPVNDYCAWYPIMGPLKNRGPKLGEHVVGLMSNPMKQAEASKIPLATIGDYLWEPEKYDPQKSIQKAIDSYAGRRSRKTLSAIVNIYGDKFLGEPGFAQQMVPQNVENAARRLNLLQNTLQALSKDAAVSRLHIELEPALKEEADLLQRRVKRMEGGTTDSLLGIDFEGGAANLFGAMNKNGKDYVNYVYAQGAGRSMMKGEYVLKEAPSADCKLVISGMDDDFDSICNIEILVNGTTIFSGPSGYPNAKWAEKSYDIPKGILKAGANTIEIKNTEPSGALGMPPWFMVAEVWVR